MDQHRVIAIRSLFGLLSLGAAAAGGIYAYNESSSWWLVAFVVAMALFAFGRALPDLITDPRKGRRATVATEPAAASRGRAGAGSRARGPRTGRR
jgi:4-hydroxybenzoate polyprenyltransferase